LKELLGSKKTHFGVLLVKPCLYFWGGPAGVGSDELRDFRFLRNEREQLFPTFFDPRQWLQTITTFEFKCPSEAVTMTASFTLKLIVTVRLVNHKSKGND
jgi:hypothetical protein